METTPLRLICSIASPPRTTRQRNIGLRTCLNWGLAFRRIFPRLSRSTKAAAQGSIPAEKFMTIPVVGHVMVTLNAVLPAPVGAVGNIAPTNG